MHLTWWITGCNPLPITVIRARKRRWQPFRAPGGTRGPCVIRTEISCTVMNMRVHSDPRTLLEIAAEVLTADPTASLGDVAVAAGIGRTTLHKRYPRREDLLLAIGHDALRAIGAGIDGARLPAAAGDAAGHLAALRRLVEALVPLGAQVHFLLRQPALDSDPELLAQVDALDEPVLEFATAAQAAGVLRAGLAPWWIVSTLYSITYGAWEGVTAGRLAPLDAGELAFATITAGIGVTR